MVWCGVMESGVVVLLSRPVDSVHREVCGCVGKCGVVWCGVVVKSSRLVVVVKVQSVKVKVGTKHSGGFRKRTK